MSLIAGLTSFVLVGCAESDGYVDYSSLPQTEVEGTTSAPPEPEPPHTAPEQNAEDSGTEKSTATVQQASVTEADIANVKPAQAVYGAGDQGGDETEAPREIKLLIKDKTFPAIKGSDAIRVG